MIALAYYTYHTRVHVGTRNSLYEALAALCSLLHIIENVSLIMLTYVSSNENYGKLLEKLIFFLHKIEKRLLEGNSLTISVFSSMGNMYIVEMNLFNLMISTLLSLS